MVLLPERIALFLFVVYWVPAIALRASTSSSSTSSSSSQSTTTDRTVMNDYASEVVGANGRIGTFWLQKQPESSVAFSPAIPCPRGTTPGSQSNPGTPIYVATPSDAYLEIYEATPETRRRDLVFVGNAGLPIDDRFEECTVLVPHFSVLYKNQWKSKNNDDDDDDDKYKDKSTTPADSYSTRSEIQVNTDPLTSPPTYVYGRHAETASAVLEANGIRTEIVGSFRALKAYSGRKLIWASCLWLLCHNHDCGEKQQQQQQHQHQRSSLSASSSPLTVGQVHELRQADLNRLVEELLPSLRELLSLDETDATNNNANNANNNNNDNDDQRDPTRRIVDRDEVREYLRAYSTSISRAVPSVDLAKKEFHDRNGVWLFHQKVVSSNQPFHIELLKRQGVDVDADVDADESEIV